ncbi:LysR family transcriptional regulator [Halobacillus salinarum]|uniref:LysR family transcriptional regulator n=1 Tax=Halobacillus salinarum TaxID=2932257 RepID=A0ABY4EMP7_9BACI|nr:LysR family transcriptional regulator [Halobacillus salinarum]UOQ44882.1 LysR family transcriptional regulator [Halobacillus salinarum]
MEINQLRAFDLVVRLGSFSKASRYLDVTQPAISQRIKELEKSVGGPLFHRIGIHMELTDLGKGFLPYARQALEILNKGTERAQSIKEGKWGEITIGTLPTFTTGIFTSVISSMYANFPYIELAIHTGHNQQIIEMLYDGFIKLGLVTYPFYNSDLKELQLLKEPLILAAHCNHKLSKLMKGSYTIQHVFKKANPFILTDWSDESKTWQRSSITFGMDTIELPPATALEIVLSGKGVALLTESMAQGYLKSGQIVRLYPSDFLGLFRWIALVSLESKSTLTPAANNFIKTLNETINEN